MEDEQILELVNNKVRSMLDLMKFEYFMENFDKITEDQLRQIVKQ